MVSAGLISLAIYVYVYTLAVLTTLEITGFAIFIYKTLKRCIPYFRSEAYNSLPPVALFEGMLDSIRSIAISEVFLVWCLFLLTFGFLYLVYWIIKNFVPETVLFFPLRKRLLDNILFTELNRSGLFPLAERVYAAIFSKKDSKVIARTIFTDIGLYTKGVFDDMIGFVEKATDPQAVINMLKKLSGSGESNNDAEYKDAKAFTYSDNYSTIDNKKLESAYHACIDTNWVKINNKSSYMDKVSAMAKNNGVVAMCSIDNAIKMSNMKQSVDPPKTDAKTK